MSKWINYRAWTVSMYMLCPLFYHSEFARLAQTAIEKVAQWFVWICKQVGQLNDCELRRADSEIKDLVDGRYDGRIRRFENHHGGLSR